MTQSTAAPPSSISLTQARQALDALGEHLNTILVGKRDKIDLVLTCLLAQGHLLLDDLPGTGKTTLAKALATSVGGRFARLQCTPDLLPTDVTGFQVFNQKSREFEFHPGPVFSDILLADEVNRTTPRTQSALLEAMAERQVTIDAQAHHLSDSFFVIATQNPIDSHGAYPLPEAQLDRFMMKLELGYPDRDAQLQMLSAETTLGATSREPEEPLLPLSALATLQSHVANLTVQETVLRYLIDLTEATRELPEVELGVSPRGMLAWKRAAQAWALLHDRDYVTPTDLQDIAPYVLSVRLLAPMEDTGELIQQILKSVPIPEYR